MTTYGTFDIDSVPKPPDWELVDTRVEYVVRIPILTFNAFVTLAGITLGRAGWHKFVMEHLGDKAALPEYGPGGWWWWYKAFTSAANAQDQAETQQDALR